MPTMFRTRLRLRAVATRFHTHGLFVKIPCRLSAARASVS